MAYRALFLSSCGTLGARALWGWLNAGHEVAGYWRSEREFYRHWTRDRRLSRIAPDWTVSAALKRHDIPVRSIPRLPSWPEAASEASATGADLLISIACPDRIPKSVLDAFPNRAVNVHPALVPAYRGPVPLLGMLLDRTGADYGGVTLHLMTPEFDEGDIIARLPVPHQPDWRLREWELHCAAATGRLIGEALPRYLDGEIDAHPQNDAEATYRRMAPEERVLGGSLNADDIRWRVEKLGNAIPLYVEFSDKVKVGGFHSLCGPATGAPPRVRPATVEFDAADGRVRLWRWLRHSSSARKLHRLRLKMRMRPDDLPVMRADYV